MHLWDFDTGELIKVRFGIPFRVGGWKEGRAYGDAGLLLSSPSCCFLVRDQRHTLALHAYTHAWQTLYGHRAEVRCVRFSSDNVKLATASSDGTVKLWDARSQRKLATLTGHTKAVVSCCFSPDNERIATGSEDRKVREYSAVNAKVGGRLPVCVVSAGGMFCL